MTVRQEPSALEAPGRPLLEVKNLEVTYHSKSGPVVAVDDVSFTVHSGEVLGLAGESGCGKSTIANAIMRLIHDPGEITGGQILFEGRDILAMDPEELRQFRWRDVAMVFQSAMNALNPVMPVGEQIVDAILAHENVSRHEAVRRAKELFELVGIRADRIKAYPHEMSGGMRQRAVIAIALALKPKLLIMDEPTTALDVVVQEEIMRQINELRHELGFAVLFITHDMSLMVEISTRMEVMYAAKLIEVASADDMFRRPLHPYTQALMGAFPPMVGPRVRLTGIPDSPPDMLNPPPGCRFHPRCPRAIEQCSQMEPPLAPAGEDRLAACHLVPVTGPIPLPNPTKGGES